MSVYCARGMWLETAINYLENKYNTSRHLLKTSLHYRVKHENLKKSEFSLPILDDRAMPNFHHKFVNC